MTAIKVRTNMTRNVRFFDIDDIRKIGHAHADAVLSMDTIRRQDLSPVDSVLYIQHEDMSEDILAYGNIITFTGEPCDINLVDDLGNRIRCNSDDIYQIMNGKARAIMGTNYCQENRIDLNESMVLIDYKDGRENTLSSEWSINFKSLTDFSDF